MEIEHDPEEPKRDTGPSPWPWAFLMCCGFLGVYWWLGKLEWQSAILGAAVTFAGAFWFVDLMRYELFKSWRDTGRGGRPGAE